MFIEITLIYKGDEFITEIDDEADSEELISYFKENLSIDSKQECALIIRRGGIGKNTSNTILELIEDSHKTVGKKFTKKT